MPGIVLNTLYKLPHLILTTVLREANALFYRRGNCGKLSIISILQTHTYKTNKKKHLPKFTVDLQRSYKELLVLLLWNSFLTQGRLS